MELRKGFRTNHVFYRSELRTIYNMVDKDSETFLNVVSEMLAEREKEINQLKTELRELSNYETQ